MGGGLAFLTKKSFNPSNINNQKVVWQAQQREASAAEKARQRADELKREHDNEGLACIRFGKSGGDLESLKFMYEAPPGLSKQMRQSTDDDDAGKDGSRAEAAALAGPDLFQRQEGDDDAAAAFRRMLASSNTDSVTTLNNSTVSTLHPDNSTISTTLSGTSVLKKNAVSDQRTQLEKAVGRRAAPNTDTTFQEQVERFPQLKNAPMAQGMKHDAINVKFNPLGVQIRNVRCLSCGIWGHARGERECSLSGWDPFKNQPSIAQTITTTNLDLTAPPSDMSRKAPSRQEWREQKPSNPFKKISTNSSNSSSEESISSEEERRSRAKRHERRRKRQEVDKVYSYRPKTDRESKGHSKRRHESSSTRKGHRRRDDDCSDESDASRIRKKHREKRTSNNRRH